MDQPQTPFDLLVSLITGLDNKVNVLSNIVKTNSTGLDELNKRFNNFHNTFKGLSGNVAANTEAINSLKSAVQDLGDQVEPLDQKLEELQGDFGKVSKDLGESIDKVNEDLGDSRRCLEKQIREVNDQVSQVNQRLNNVENRLTDRINAAEKRLGDSTKELKSSVNKIDERIHKLENTTRGLSNDLYSVNIARGHVTNLQGDVQEIGVMLKAQRRNELARLANSFAGNGTIEPLVAMDMSRISDLPSSDVGIDHLQGRPQ